MQVTIWTTTNCVQCMQTKKQFDKFGIKYEEKSLEENLEQLEAFKEQGFASAPIVQAGLITWSGFRLDHIKDVEHKLFGEKKNG